MAASSHHSQIEEARKQAEEEAAKRKDELNNMPIKQGDYQVQVHIIELRNLKPEDPNGSSDPVVYAEVMNRRAFT